MSSPADTYYRGSLSIIKTAPIGQSRGPATHQVFGSVSITYSRPLDLRH